MNYLAHLFLTKDYHEEVSVGNFFADAVKGNNAISKYPEQIQKGIRIHREIDSFTDSHPLVKKGTKRLHPNYGKFAGIIVDIFYDHLLADNWEQYSEIPLVEFAQAQYNLITKHWNHLAHPERNFGITICTKITCLSPTLRRMLLNWYFSEWISAWAVYQEWEEPLMNCGFTKLNIQLSLEAFF